VPGIQAFRASWRAPQAEMSEDEGHSDSGSDVEADADGVLVRLHAPGPLAPPPDLPGAPLPLMSPRMKQGAREAGRRSGTRLPPPHVLLKAAAVFFQKRLTLPRYAPQADLIGAGAERRGDEKRRAALHASWAAERDEQAVKDLLEGVRGGFRKRRRGGALDDAVRA